MHALQLGCSRAVCVDNVPESVAAAPANAATNGLTLEAYLQPTQSARKELLSTIEGGRVSTAPLGKKEY